MKHFNKFLLTLLMSGAAVAGASAEEYLCDFNEPIVTTSPSFKVASNWKHVPEGVSSYSGTYYMTYAYQAENGVDGSGCLWAENQEAGYYSKSVIEDFLITPKVKGNVSLKYQTTSISSYYPGFIQIFLWDDDTDTKGAKLKEISYAVQTPSSNAGDFATLELDEPLEDYTRLAIRMQRVRIDDFRADDALIEPEPSFIFTSIDPNPSTGTISWTQAPDFTIPIKFTVKIKNTGDIDLTEGMNKYSVSLYTKAGAKVGESVPVNFDLAKGEESDEFEVAYTIPQNQISSIFSTYAYFVLKCDFTGEGSEIQQSMYSKYESLFVFQTQDYMATTTYSIGSTQTYGMSTTPITKNYQIRNRGVAPLEIKSITLPEGFTTDLEETEFTLESMEVKDMTVTLSEAGPHSGNLTIVYKNAGAETTTAYQCQFAGNLVAEGVWYTDFNGPSSNKSSYVWPEGSMAESNVDISGTNLQDGIYDISLYARYSSNSHFYTPLLHANAGDKLTFDVKKYSSSSSGDLKVYVTEDRAVKGDPVLTITYNNMPTNWATRSITIPEEGDYYIIFDVYGNQLDNISGLSKVEKAHDLMIKDYSITPTEDGVCTVRSGKEISGSVTVAPLMSEAADDYTVTLYFNDEPVALTDSIKSIDLTASASSTKDFKFTYTPVVEETTTYESFVRFEFTDGTIIDTPKKNVKVTYEPFFFFGQNLYVTGNYKPTQSNVRIAYGKLNEPMTLKYQIGNWGGAPLNVTSITVPEGFSVDTNECVVPGISVKDIEITFDAETAGIYEGNLEIMYEGADEPYTCPISGTMLDPTKWYATFTRVNSSDSGSFPVGTMAQSGITFYAAGTYAAPKDVMTCTQAETNTTGRMFISPLLHAEEGETFTVDAGNGSSYQNAILRIYASHDRNELRSKDSEGKFGDAILLAEFAKTAEGENFLDYTESGNGFKTYTVAVPEEGDWYIGFEPIAYARVHEIVGLTPVPTTFDMLMEGAVVPETGMQNNDKSGKMKVRNLLSDLEAGSYTVRSYVNGELSLEKEGDVVIPRKNQLSAVPTEIEMYFRSPKAGTFPVYFELDANGKTIATEPVDVIFSEEVASADLTIGTKTATASDKAPLDFYFKNAESVSVYPADYLKEYGLKQGDRITSMSFKGYTTKTELPEITLKVYYKWVDETVPTMPTGSTRYEEQTNQIKIEDMTKVYDGDFTLVNNGATAANMLDMISLTLTEPAVYEEGKSLYLVVMQNNPSYSKTNWETSNKSGQAYQHASDSGPSVASWSACALPVLHLGLAVEATTLSGVVENGDGEAIEGATVTLISNDGDNIQYTGQTDAEGAYSINVIQNSREYDVEVKADDKEDFENGIAFDESVEQNFTLLDVIQISDDGDHTDAPANAVVYLQKSLNAGFNAVALPISLNGTEVEEIFGEDVIVLEFGSVTEEGAATEVHFLEVENKAMEAGKPYILYTEEESREASFKTKGAMTALKTTTTAETDFLATEKRTPVADKMFILSEDNFVGGNKQRMVTELPAYSGYIKADNANAVTFTTNANINTGIEDAEIVKEGADVIYDLNGIRVKNPEKGIYIINGKAVRVK